MTDAPRIERIAYRDGYRYQLAEWYAVDVRLTPAAPIATHWLALDMQGVLTIAEGYAWDGASGPAIDSPCFMRGSLIHDALYQLIREGHLPIACRAHADRLLREMCREDGMSAIRAWWVYQGVRRFGGAAVEHGKPVKYAPRQTTP